MVIKLEAATQVKAIILYVQYGSSDIIEKCHCGVPKIFGILFGKYFKLRKFAKIILLVLFPNNCSILYGFSNSYVYVGIDDCIKD